MHLSLPDFSAFRVLVCGDVMLDRYWHGATARISPEAPVPVVQVLGDELRAGGAGNVALNVASLGARARVVGLVGDDEAGRLLEDRLGERGVECAFERVQDAPTITKLRVISRHQQLIRLDFEERFAALHAERVLAFEREREAAIFRLYPNIQVMNFGKSSRPTGEAPATSMLACRITLCSG